MKAGRHCFDLFQRIAFDSYSMYTDSMKNKVVTVLSRCIPKHLGIGNIHCLSRHLNTDTLEYGHAGIFEYGHVGIWACWNGGMLEYGQA